jgi:RND family efflux transporter MFP subunit
MLIPDFPSSEPVRPPDTIAVAANRMTNQFDPQQRHGYSRQHLRDHLPYRCGTIRCITFFLLLLAGLATPVAAQVPGTQQIEATQARAVSYRPEFRAYARVEPISLVTVKSGLDGVIADLSAQPGQRLSAGEVFAHLGGAEQVKARVEAQARLAAAEQDLVQARDSEKAVADTYRRKLADRTQLDQAKTKLAAAQASVTEAKAELAQLETLDSIDTPVSGRVVALSTASGSRVARDDPVLTIQPDHDLWLRAVFYDLPTDRLSPGRAAKFVPANGAKELPVSFAQRLPSLRKDGGLTAFFEADASEPSWTGGESGEVVVTGESRAAVTVPSSALILDQGRWWVLVHSADGLRRQAVEPGPSRGLQTLILQGLAAGDAVVVRDAYLLFHRDFGQHYTPPD